MPPHKTRLYKCNHCGTEKRFHCTEFLRKPHPYTQELIGNPPHCVNCGGSFWEDMTPRKSILLPREIAAGKKDPRFSSSTLNQKE